MAIPDYQALMLPTLRLAAAAETRVPEVATAIANELGLTEAEQEELLPSGRQRLLNNRIHWAKTYLTKAGLLDVPSRGRFIASNEGRALLQSNPGKIDLETLKRYPLFIQFYSASSTSSPDEAPIAHAAAEGTATPEEQIVAAHTVLHAALAADLLQRIQSQSPTFFESVIVDLLVSMGYGSSHADAAQRLGRTGDGGVDGVIDQDRLGLDRIYVQAKRYAPHVSVGRPEVQSFVGSLVGLGATRGVFVTTSNFSSLAIDYVRNLPQRVILVNGSKLADLMIEHGVGVRVSRSFDVKRVDEDFFVDD